MKRKNQEVGLCGMCGQETIIKIPRIKRVAQKNQYRSAQRKRFYCGCKGPRAT